VPRRAPDLDLTFRALAAPARRAVVARLSAGPATVSELAAPFDMALPSFMQHLDVLEQGGLVRSHKDGRVRTYELVRPQLDRAAHWLDAQRAVRERRFDQLDALVTSPHLKDLR
jgi:DNA-binding transcriptional ArsR family regulator